MRVNGLMEGGMAGEEVLVLAMVAMIGALVGREMWLGYMDTPILLNTANLVSMRAISRKMKQNWTVKSNIVSLTLSARSLISMSFSYGEVRVYEMKLFSQTLKINFFCQILI